MLTDEAIAQINRNLDLCDTYLLNQSEIDYQDAIGSNPINTCEYWTTTQDVLNIRSQTDTSINDALEILLVLSEVDGCVITLEPEPVPDVDIPYFAGGL